MIWEVLDYRGWEGMGRIEKFILQRLGSKEREFLQQFIV